MKLINLTEENTHYEASMHESHYGRGKSEGRVEEKYAIATRKLKTWKRRKIDPILKASVASLRSDHHRSESVITMDWNQ